MQDDSEDTCTVLNGATWSNIGYMNQWRKNIGAERQDERTQT